MGKKMTEGERIAARIYPDYEASSPGVVRAAKVIDSAISRATSPMLRTLQTIANDTGYNREDGLRVQIDEIRSIAKRAVARFKARPRARRVKR